MFYKIVISTIFWISSYEPLTLEGLVKTLIPIRTLGTGFTAAFLLFFLFIPFLNILVKNMNEKQHILLLGLVSFTYIFLGTVPFFSVTMNYVSWFMVLYIIASYIRLYPKQIFNNTKLWTFVSVVLIIIASLSVIVCAYISKEVDRSLWYYFVQDSNTLLAVLIGVSTFLFFKNLKMKHHPAINKISATCFGVLLIHANSDAMRTWLWSDTLNNVGWFTHPTAVVITHSILSVILIYTICTVIDWLRINFFEKPFFSSFGETIDKLQNRIFAS
jgi:hypothetical protein